MKIAKLCATVALLLFVAATVGMLIAQEVTQPDSAPVAESAGAGVSEEVNAGATAVEEEQSASPGVMASVDTPLDDSDVSSQEVASRETSPVAETESVCVIDAIYFHNTLRCHTCRMIEETAKAVLEAEFSEELAAGQLRWSTVNMERQRHYVEEFDLVKPTLILVRTLGEEQSDWAALDETWDLIRSERRFADYVKSGTRAFLEACP